MAQTTASRTRVVIDGFNLSLEKGTGVATYARNLSFALGRAGFDVGALYGMPELSSEVPLLREVGFFDTTARQSPMWRQMAWAGLGRLNPIDWPLRVKPLPLSGAVIYDNFRARLPHFDRLYNAHDVFRRAEAKFRMQRRIQTLTMAAPPQIMHWTYPLPLRLKGAKNVYTLHDLVPLRLPFTTLDNKRNYYALVKRLVRDADHIVTVSECSRTDIIALLGADPQKVTNTYQSVTIPPSLVSKPDDEVKREIENAFPFRFKEYYLFFGAIEPKKNIARLIDAFLASSVEAPLIIVGARGWKSDQELRRLDADRERALHAAWSGAARRQRIIHLDYVPFPLLVSIIRGAKATLFPSLYEGFGLPVLESMALGTPVIASNVSSIPEVAGDAAILVNPYETGALVAAIEYIDRHAEMRAALSEKGRKQAALFSEARHAKALQDVYAKLK